MKAANQPSLFEGIRKTDDLPKMRIQLRAKKCAKPFRNLEMEQEI